MKTIKKVALAIAGAAALLTTLGLAATAHAQQVALSCSGGSDEIIAEDIEQICDLSVDKQVSINSSSFVEADTSADAAQAQVGDTVTWKIVVTNNSSEGLTPHGAVYVHDLLPSGVSYGSSSATAGNYITSGFFANYWYIPLLNSDSRTNLPATLTITSTSTATGLFQNTATLAKYDAGSCDGGCAYVDGDPTNDSNDAWIDPSAKPAVLAASTTNSSSTLANTGNSAVVNIVAGVLILTAVGIVNRDKLARRKKYSIR